MNKKAEKNRYNLINNFALRNAWMKQGYDPTDTNIARTLGISTATYRAYTTGIQKMPMQIMIETMVRCRMTKNQFMEAFFDCFDERGRLDTYEAQRVYNNITEEKKKESRKKGKTK